jgi:hypothetical protein
MLDTVTSTQDTPGQARRRYRLLVYGIVGAGILGLFVGVALDQRLAGTVVYLAAAWIGGGIAFLAPQLSDATLQDERDSELHNRASGLTIGVLTVVGIGTVPALYVLDAGGQFEIPGAAWGAIWLGSAVFLLYGVCLGIVKRRQ